MDYTQLSPQERDLDIIVPAESSTGGVKMHDPFACYRIDGVWDPSEVAA